jgi:hypothetical protein
MRKLILTVAALLALQVCFAASAMAQQTLPPGNSGIDQYTENVPSAGGDKPTAGPGAGGGGGAAGGQTTVLSPGTKSKLDKLGANGKAAARAAEATGPSRGSGQATSDNPPGSDGFGFLLPLFLVLALLGAAAVYFARTRRSGAPG